jgi:hypothetical protein
MTILTSLLISAALLLVAVVLLAIVLSDALLQRLSAAVRGAPLEPRQLLTVRKVGYVVLVLYLFTWAFLWRRSVVDASGAPLAVREQSRGEVHLTGSLVRLGLGGFRGVTTCYLWNLAMEKQMKNQLNELEVIVGWLTELQPHFNTPWLFQSWNLAYNVSNKTDRISDKYFYITRGIRLLADGERQNHDDPDLRFEMAQTYQHKICQSDETNYHRSLFQLSMIPPNERDPARFRPKPGSAQKVNLEEFVKFCEKHPQLVRRLREGVHKDNVVEQRRLFTCPTPEALVRFLADNYRVPSLYPESKPTPADAPWVENNNQKPDPDVLERFPVLPPPRRYADQGQTLQHPFRPYDDMRDGDQTDQSPYGQDVDAWDAYLAARAWYSYAQEPLPPPGDKPGDDGTITDTVHQRLNRRMNTIIFRQYPARAQAYIAERLEEEGWFDGEGWSTKGPEWPAVVIGDKGGDWAVDAWEEAYKMWKAHGERNHILLPEDEEKKLVELTDKWGKEHGLTGPQDLPRGEEGAEQKKALEAIQFRRAYEGIRNLTNYPHNYGRARVERLPEVVRARKLFYQAEALASTGSTIKALQTYQDPDPDPIPVLKGLSALDAWAKILDEQPDFRRDSLIQEETFETELAYLDVLNRALPGNEVKAQLGAAATAGGGWLNAAGLLEARQPNLFPALAVSKGPFDRMDKDGAPWIPAPVMKQVEDRRRLYQPRRRDVEQGPAPQPLPRPTPGVGPEQPGPGQQRPGAGPS